uniref:Transmembrane protein n=1 Tax=Macrostomum lignano TaxID=282301 RepID=A0A1I8FKS2_9PLAT
MANEFAVQYLPKVWQRVNSSLAELSHQMAACDPDLPTVRRAPLPVWQRATANPPTEASVYLVRLDGLLTLSQPTSNGGISSLPGLGDCAKFNAYILGQRGLYHRWQRELSPRPAIILQLQSRESEMAAIASTVVFVAFVAFTALAAVVLVKRQRVQLRRDQQQQQQQPKSETTVELELQPMQAHTAAAGLSARRCLRDRGYPGMDG